MATAGSLLDKMTTKAYIAPNIGVSSSASKLAQQKADIDLIIKSFNIYLLQEITVNKNEAAVDALLIQPTTNIKNTNLELKSNYESLSVLTKSGVQTKSVQDEFSGKKE